MEKYNNLLGELDQIYASCNVYDLMVQIIKRDDLYEFIKVWEMFDNGVERQRLGHSAQGYCANAVQYNAIKIFKWIVDNRWGYIYGHWDRVWRVECIMTSIVFYDRIDMMKILIESGKDIVGMIYEFKSVEMLNIVLHEMEQGKFLFKKTMSIYSYLEMYLLLAQTPQVVEYLLSIGIKLRSNIIQRYVDNCKYDNIVYLLDNKLTSVQDVYTCMTTIGGWRCESRIFNLLVQLRESGHVKCDDTYDDTYQYLLDLVLQKNYPNVKEFIHLYELGGNVGELSGYKNNKSVINYMLTHPTYAICDGDYKLVTGDDVCKCFIDYTGYNKDAFYLLVYLREFGFIQDVDLYNQVYQSILDNLAYDFDEKWFALGANQGPTHVASYIRFPSMVDKLTRVVNLVGYQRVMEWLWGMDEYKQLVKFLRENGYVSNWELIQFRCKKMKC